MVSCTSSMLKTLFKLELCRAHIPRASLAAMYCITANCMAYEHEWLVSQLWVWLIGVANTKASLLALLASAVRFLAKISPDFAVFDSTVAIIAR